MEFVLMELRSNQDTHQRKSILKKARNKTWWTQITEVTTNIQKLETTDERLHTDSNMDGS